MAYSKKKTPTNRFGQGLTSGHIPPRFGPGARGNYDKQKSAHSATPYDIINQKGQRQEGKTTPAERRQRGFRPNAAGSDMHRRSRPAPYGCSTQQNRDRTQQGNSRPVYGQYRARSQFRPVPAPVAPPAPQPEVAYSELENLLVGRNPIREALKSGRDMEKILVSSGEFSGSAREIIHLAKEAGVIVQTVERSRLDQITRNHQGMIAFASAYAYASVEEILQVAKERGEPLFIVILDKVTDPQNLGAIIRTASCVGAHGVIVQLHRAVGLTPSAVKASAGAVEHVKVARVVNINNTIKELKQKDIWVYAADTKGSDFQKTDFTGGCALVIGSEGEGVSQLTLSLCDQVISIPMTGPMDSLNASVAAGILMYAVFQGRRE